MAAYPEPALPAHELDLSILIKALRGLTLWRPIAVMGTALFIGLLILAILERFSGTGAAAFLFLALGFLVYFVAVGAGYLGAGHSLAATVQGREAPGILDCLLFGLFTLPRLIGLVLLESLLLLGLLVAEVILVEICRIPALGGLLSLVVFPGLFLVNIASVLAFMVIFSLSGPALWFGETVSGALGHLVAVARSRPGPVIFILALLIVLVSIVTVMIAALAFYSAMLTGSLISSLVLSGVLGGILQPLIHNPIAAFSMLGGQGVGLNGELYIFAFGLTILLVTAISVAIPNNVFLLGLAYLYDESTKTVDAEAGHAFVGGVMQKVGRAAEAAQKRAEAAAARARAQAQQASAHASAAGFAPPPAAASNPDSAASVAATPVHELMHCPHCGAAAQPGDRFCGECGKPLAKA
ncbi:MAG: zinc ribbon domain-containing protein [Acidithiobacillus sp.]|uniref:zinc ribbon domain-containing protein n=1 Tax=Acidithiobacillus sp. TaxID=1872118 RepID=UPI003D037CE4